MKNLDQRSILKAPMYLAFLAIFLFIVWEVWQIQKITPQDRLGFQQLKEKAGGENFSKNQSWKAKQERLGIQKDLFFIKDGLPLHVRILAEKAELLFDQEGRKTGLIEQFEQMRCLMQEEIYFQLEKSGDILVNKKGKYLFKNSDPERWLDFLPENAKPMQILRYLEADTAFYYHHEDRLEAENVKVYRYAVEGHELHESLLSFTPLFKGHARKVECTLTGSEPQFQAYQLKMTLFQGEK